MTTQIDLLKKYGLKIRGHVGQHLLIDPNMQRKIVELLEIEPSDSILEIGPGLGALTAHLLDRPHSYKAVELDEKFVQILKKEYAAFSHKSNQLIHADILKTDLVKLFSSEKKSDQEKLAGKKVKVISNLPYYITAPIIFHLLEHRELFSKMVLMVQKEVAARLCAFPGSKDYGRLTLAMRYAGIARHAFDVPPQCFAPPPAVDSRVVVLDLYPQTALSGIKEKALFGLIQTAFSQRRKMFINLLARDIKWGKNREEVEAMFNQLRLPLKARGEELLLKDYLALLDLIFDKDLLPKALKKR